MTQVNSSSLTQTQVSSGNLQTQTTSSNQSANDLPSGDGHWQIGVPTGDAITITDPGVEDEVSVVQLTIDLKANQQQSLTFTGPPSNGTEADSIGFTAFTQVKVINDTGHALQDVVLNLANVDPRPLNIVPGVIEFGTTVNANYAFFSDVLPVSEQTTAMFSPDGNATTPIGAAASTLAYTGGVAPGGSFTGAFVLHNTELATGSNDFVMNVQAV